MVQFACKGSRSARGDAETLDFLGLIQPCDFLREAGIDRGAAKFAHGSQQAIVGGERIADQGEVADLAVVGEFGVEDLQSDLHGSGLDRACDQGAEIAAAVAHDDYLLGGGKELGNSCGERGARLVDTIEEGQRSAYLLRSRSLLLLLSGDLLLRSRHV